MPHDVNYRPKTRRASRVVDLSGRDYGALDERPALGREDGTSEQVRSVSAPIDYNSSGSATLKALVRFGLATLGANVAWFVAVAFRLGEFEIWLAMAAGFITTLALSMFGYARGVVHLLSEVARWLLVSAVALSGLWLAFQFLR
jgi:hypothetical protein